MQSTTKFTKSDLAKYPFLKSAAEYVKELDFKVEDLTDPQFNAVLKRAQERIEEAILYVLVSGNPRNEDIEILSFPTAIILAIATENSFIKKRYATAEAKKAFNDLKFEPKGKLLAVAQNFEWEISTIDNIAFAPYEFALNFADYLRNTTHLRDKKWKLVNRLLSKGSVLITRSEAARLLSEEVRRYIEKRLEVKGKLKFPAEIVEIAEKIKKLSVEKVGEAEIEGLPKTIVNEAFPPCIKTLYESITVGRHLSHVGRFALTSFLINVGMPTENVIDLFRNFSDFNERMTRYQVEHIAGERGSRTRYTPPKCETLQTHGVCVNPDEICKTIRHPLGYYKRKLRKS
ncbi:MAG: DNA primase large subunit PriL [Candidatus Bathyarchaeia archaeon]